MGLKTDGIIFDVDGTIWDTTAVVADAWNAALSDAGYSERVDAKRLKELFGLPMIDIVNAIVGDEDISKNEKLLEKLSDYEMDYLEKYGAPVYEKLETVLEELSGRVRLFIVSNCQAGYIELMLKKTGLAEYITDYCCPDDTGLLKAGNIGWIAGKHDLKMPVYVGDTRMDELACAAAGVPFVFAAYGFGKTASPSAVIKKPVELTDIIE